jgi:hypothetical protein
MTLAVPVSMPQPWHLLPVEERKSLAIRPIAQEGNMIVDKRWHWYYVHAVVCSIKIPEKCYM